MKATITVELIPPAIPSLTAKPSCHGGEPIPVYIGDLDVNALDALADDFRKRLFETAGKRPPPVVMCAPEPRPPDITKMVDRFLAWPLPKDFAPDCYISFNLPDPVLNPNPLWPVGTNLFTADQARAMFEYVLLAK